MDSVLVGDGASVRGSPPRAIRRRALLDPPQGGRRYALGRMTAGAHAGYGFAGVPLARSRARCRDRLRAAGTGGRPAGYRGAGPIVGRLSVRGGADGSAGV